MYLLTGVDMSEVCDYRYNVMNRDEEGEMGVVIPGISVSEIP